MEKTQKKGRVLFLPPSSSAQASHGVGRWEIDAGLEKGKRAKATSARPHNLRGGGGEGVICSRKQPHIFGGKVRSAAPECCVSAMNDGWNSSVPSYLLPFQMMMKRLGKKIRVSRGSLNREESPVGGAERRTDDGWMDGSRWGVTPSLRPSASLALCTKWDGDFTIHSHGITHMIKLTLDIRRLGTVWRGVYVQAIWQSV